MFESTLEIILIILIVALILALGGRSFYRVMIVKNKGECCGCDACHCRDTPQHEL